jgi:UDP-glucuronate 4-epimerase
VKVLVTGTAGFIGNALALRLLARGDEVVGVDNLDPYYDVELKKARLARVADHPGFTDLRVDIADRDAMAAVFDEHRPQRVVNLAAQAGCATR